MERTLHRLFLAWAGDGLCMGCLGMGLPDLAWAGLALHWLGWEWAGLEMGLAGHWLNWAWAAVGILRMVWDGLVWEWAGLGITCSGRIVLGMVWAGHGFGWSWPGLVMGWEWSGLSMGWAVHELRYAWAVLNMGFAGHELA